MNSLFALLLTLLVFSSISVQFTSSASFPNPPQFPAPNATTEEWTLFWKLLHNYYAIIARPRFGKRYDSLVSEWKRPSLLKILRSHHVPFEDDQEVVLDDFYTFSEPDQRRRRR